MIHLNRVLFSCLILFISLLNAQTFQSTQNRTNIIELYTSQGCSSCPRADKWLGDLKNHPELFKTFIPMAFHITYWNFIGWKDVFAKEGFDRRQSYYAREVWGKENVYTPQFITNAKEYRRWFSFQSFPSFEEIYGGKLNIKINDKHVDIRFMNNSLLNERLIVNIAILGFDYSISIKRGENRSKTLHHDFVVLEHEQYYAHLKEGKFDVDVPLPKITNDKHQKAVVVWLSNDKQSQIIQAVGGYLK